MLVKKSEKKTASPAMSPKAAVAKANKVAKKGKEAKKLKEKPVANVKKAVKDGLVKAPAPKSPKVGKPPVKKVLDEKALAAKKEKQKQKKLEKKLKKAAAKKELAENCVAKEDSKKKQPQENGTKTEAGEKEAGGKAKDKKKKKNAEAKGPIKAQLDPAHTVFVGNLPTNTKRVQLVKVFSSCAPIVAIRFRTATGKVIFKHKTRKEAGALNAYITLTDDDSVAKALELNGFEFKSNHLRVTKSDAKLEEDVDAKRMVFVGNLKYSANDEKLRQIFSSCGEIEYVRTVQESEKNGCNGTAFVYFKNPDSVGLALELKGTMLDERPINVERYSVKKLGAKAKRDSEGEKADVKRPQKGKQQKKKQPGDKKKPAKPAAGTEEKKKKSEFRGVKSDGIKKKQKKVPSEMKKLAKKIAPKSDD